MVALPPHHCAVCGRCFANEYFHTQGGGELIAFADFDDSAARHGYVPGVVGVAWICNEHLSAARQRLSLPTETAIWEIQQSFGVRPDSIGGRKPNPELFVIDVGPNRARVLSIVRQATGASPENARDLLDHVPAKMAEGWPTEFETWRRALCEAGATVEIRWD